MAAPAGARKAWMVLQLGGLAVIEIVVGLVLIVQISQGEMVIQGMAILAGLVVVDVILYVLLRRAVRQGEFRDYDDEKMARLGCTCGWNSGERKQVDLACPSHGDGSG